MSTKPLLVFYSDRFKNHDTGSHPERPERMDAINKALHKSLPVESVEWSEPRPATKEELALVHSEKHIHAIESLAKQGGGMADPDTVVSPASFTVASLSAGALLAGVDAIYKNKSNRAFIVSRPPGHHALSGKAMGFCLFNNIAITARYAQNKYNVKKILILDWDVHHGNGTQDIFYEDDTVFYISTHQHPLYPGTGLAHERGRGRGEGYTRNEPFPPQTEPQRIVDAVTKVLDETGSFFKPDLLLISAGFDGHRDDPLSDWLLVEEHFTKLTEISLDLAKKYCNGKILSCLEGGYNLEALAASCTVHGKELVKHT